MNSNTQNGLVAGSAQKRLIISDVQWDIRNKQWRVTGPQQHNAIQENPNPHINGLLKAPTKRRRRRKKVEDSAEHTLSEKSHNQKIGENVGGLSHLLILADSAELLAESRDKSIGGKNHHQYLGSQISQDICCLPNRLSTFNSSDEKHTENMLDLSHGVHSHEAEKSALHLHGKMRLTNLRRQARSKSHPVVQKTQESNAPLNVYPKCFPDIQAEKVVTDGEKEMVESQGVEVQGGNQQIDFRREQPSMTKLQQTYGQYQPSIPHHLVTMVTHPPTHFANAPQLGPSILREPLMKDYTSVSLQGPVNSVVNLQTQKDHKSITRERRMSRTHKRKKRLGNKQVHEQQSPFLPEAQMNQMYAAGQQWQWQMWDFQNWKLWEEERQRACQNGCNQSLQRNHQPNLVVGSDADKLQANIDFSRSTIIDFQGGVSTSLDHSTEQQNHEPVKAYREKTTSVKGRTRVSHLKREARTRNTDGAEENPPCIS